MEFKVSVKSLSGRWTLLDFVFKAKERILKLAAPVRCCFCCIFSQFVCWNASREFVFSFLQSSRVWGHRVSFESLYFIVCLWLEAVKSWSIPRLRLPEKIAKNSPLADSCFYYLSITESLESEQETNQTKLILFKGTIPQISTTGSY